MMPTGTFWAGSGDFARRLRGAPSFNLLNEGASARRKDANVPMRSAFLWQRI